MILIKKNLTFLIKKPFIIFKIDNFLNEDDFNDIVLHAPKSKNLQDTEIKFVDNKLSLSTDTKKSDEKYFKKYKSMNNLVTYFNQKKTKKYFIEKFKYYYIISQFKAMISIFLNDEKKPYSIWFKLSIKSTYSFLKSLLAIFNIIKLDVRIEYSFIRNEGFILPHTDSKSKFISLMLYFPKYKENDLEFNKENQLGTILYDSKLKNYSSTHLSGDQLNIFFKESKVIQKLPFKPFHLYGFMRSSNSWHALDKININKDYERFSVNINYIVK